MSLARSFVDSSTGVLTSFQRLRRRCLAFPTMSTWGEPDQRLITHDDDFLRMHAGGAIHHGIVFARQQTPVGQLVQGIFLVSQVPSPEEMQGHVEFV